MLNSIRNIFSIPELRKRVLFTLILLAVYRIGAQIPNPGISADALAEFWQTQKGTIFGFIDLFSGRAMSRMTIFALGIMPYISASITWKGCPRRVSLAGRRSPNTRGTAHS
jgi:preprotein translocase subunit SecY